MGLSSNPTRMNNAAAREEVFIGTCKPRCDIFNRLLGEPTLFRLKANSISNHTNTCIY